MEINEKNVYILPAHQRIIAMKEICSRYSDIVYRDVYDYALNFKPFYHIRDQFQIGHIPTLRYISFHRYDCVPVADWIEGFIKSANKRKAYYKQYMFREDL